jgi:hypothetical protein
VEENFRRYVKRAIVVLSVSGVSARAITPDTHKTVPLNEYLPLNPYPLSALPFQLTEPAGSSPQPGTPKLLTNN